MKTQIIKKAVGLIAGIGLLVGASPSAMAAFTSYTGSSGGLSAQADFTLVGTTLTIKLINTGAGDVMDNADILTGLFFNTTSGLTVGSASLGSSSVSFGSLVNDVGEGWAYGHPVSAQGMNSGISAAGLGIFDLNTPANNFYNPAVTPLDGAGYGIVSAGDNTATYNGGLKSPLVKNSIVFTFTTAAGFTLAELGNTVVFQFGTDPTEPHFDGTAPVPEPSTIIAGALLLLPFGASTIRILRKNRQA